MSRRRALIALALCACSQEHLYIGAVDDVPADGGGPLLDASAPSLDAGAFDAGSDAAGPLALTLRVQGRDDVASLENGCSCLELEAVASGGTPPLVISWPDTTTGSRKTICPATDNPLLGSPTVRDARGERASARGTLRTVPCTEPLAWQACLTPSEPSPTLGCIASSDGLGTWFELAQPLRGVKATVAFELTGVLLEPTRMQIAYTESDCSALKTVYEGTQLLLQPGDIVARDLPPEDTVGRILVRFPDQPTGLPPAGLSVSMRSLCFPLEP